MWMWGKLLDAWMGADASGSVSPAAPIAPENAFSLSDVTRACLPSSDTDKFRFWYGTLARLPEGDVIPESSLMALTPPVATVPLATSWLITSSGGRAGPISATWFAAPFYSEGMTTG